MLVVKLEQTNNGEVVVSREIDGVVVFKVIPEAELVMKLELGGVIYYVNEESWSSASNYGVDWSSVFPDLSEVGVGFHLEMNQLGLLTFTDAINNPNLVSVAVQRATKLCYAVVAKAIKEAAS